MLKSFSSLQYTKDFGVQGCAIYFRACQKRWSLLRIPSTV